MTFPTLLLDETLWDFDRKPVFPSRAEFEAAVFRHLYESQEYAPEIEPEVQWRPNVIALHCPRVVVKYYCDAPGEEASWREAELRSEDGISFSNGELFHSLHNAIIAEVRDNGHRYFEGLEFAGIAKTGVPIYSTVLGS